MIACLRNVIPLVLGRYSIVRREHLLQLNSIHTLHLLINDEIDIGLIVNLGGLQQTGGTTIAEDDVLRVSELFGLEGHMG